MSSMIVTISVIYIIMTIITIIIIIVHGVASLDAHETRGLGAGSALRAIAQAMYMFMNICYVYMNIC